MMLNDTTSLSQIETQAWVKTAALSLLVLLVLRVASLFIGDSSLYADETQYWIWSQTLDWGYYSKPPMIAWVIAFTTGIFGDSDWAARLSSPFLHTFTAAFLGLSAAKLYDNRTGALVALIWALMPAVWFSANLISTDTVLMAGWSAGLYAYVRLRDGANWPFAIMLGTALGWAFLSKYAAIYFALGLAIALLIDRPSRKALLGWNGVIALGVLGALIAPNVIWNAQHDFATLSHTAANANWGGTLFQPGEALQFVIDQLGVFGPLFFPLLILAAFKAIKSFRFSDEAASPALLLAGFVVPALIVVAGQAFISRAHANWAVSAYGAGTILLAGYLLAGPAWRRVVLWTGLGLHTIAGLAMLTLSASAPLSESVGLANAFKRVREWPETMIALQSEVERSGLDIVVFDNRNDFHQFQRYGTAIDATPYMWLRHAGPLNFAETEWPLPSEFDEPVLIVSERPREVPLMQRDFARFDAFGDVRIELGGGRERHYQLFIAQGHNRLDRDRDYEAWVRQIRSGN